MTATLERTEAPASDGLAWSRIPHEEAPTPRDQTYATAFGRTGALLSKGALAAMGDPSHVIFYERADGAVAFQPVQRDHAGATTVQRMRAGGYVRNRRLNQLLRGTGRHPLAPAQGLFVGN